MNSYQGAKSAAKRERNAKEAGKGPSSQLKSNAVSSYPLHVFHTGMHAVFTVLAGILCMIADLRLLSRSSATSASRPSRALPSSPCEFFPPPTSLIQR